jgi:hypothetical protein
MLYDLYITQDIGMTDISLILGCDKSVVKRMLTMCQIPLRGRGRPHGKKKNSFTSQLREPRPSGFDVKSRNVENRKCINFSDCLTQSAIADIYVVPCKECSGEPQLDYALLAEFRSNAETTTLSYGAQLPFVDKYISERQQLQLWRDWLKTVDSAEVYIQRPRRRMY